MKQSNKNYIIFIILVVIGLKWSAVITIAIIFFIMGLIFEVAEYVDELRRR